MLSSPSYSEWTFDGKFGDKEIYYDYENAKTKDGMTKIWSMNNYPKGSDYGLGSDASSQSTSPHSYTYLLEIDCQNLGIRILVKNHFNDAMGQGYPNQIKISPDKKEWKYVAPSNEYGEYIKTVCDKITNRWVELPYTISS